MLPARQLSHQLLLWFIAIGLAPLSLVTYFLYSGAERALSQEVANGLLAIARRQVNQVGAHMRDREKDASALAQVPGVGEALLGFHQAFQQGGVGSARYASLDQRLRPFLTFYQQVYGYEDLALISPEGDVVFSVKRGRDLGVNLKAGEFQPTGLGQAFARAGTLLGTEFSDFALYPATNTIAAFVAAPVVRRGSLVGVVALHLNTQEVFRAINDYTGLGKTGETVLSKRIGDEVVILNPLRHDPTAAFNRKIRIGASLAVPSQRATQGYRGAGVERDYRNEETLAVWRYLPALGDGLVVKIDSREAFAPIQRLRSLSVGLAGLTLVVIIAAALSVARSISGPVVKLTAITTHIANGDLSRRVSVTARNEIGQLADSFNRMARQLGESIEQLKETTAARERIESELRVAHDIQMGILPKIFPPFPHRSEFEIHALLEPAKQVGGDFYDFVLLDDEELYFVIGDVSGKGVPASLFMAVTLTLFKSFITKRIEPGALLTQLNRQLCVDSASALFVTIFCGRLNANTGEMVYSNGGHHPPFLLGRDGGVQAVPMLGGLVLGMVEDAAYDVGRLRLEPGDGLVLHTDGVTEATNSRGEFFTTQRLVRCLSGPAGLPATALVDRIAADVRGFTAGAPQSDDIAILALRYRGKGGA